MKKWIIGLFAVIMAGLLIYNSFDWVSDYQDCMDYINAHFEFEEGKIIDIIGLTGGGDATTGKGYQKFIVVFDSGQVRLLKANVKLHNHITQLGPDFKILSCEFCEKTSFDNSSYGYGGSEQYRVILQKDGGFIFDFAPGMNYCLKGTYFSEDGITITVQQEGRKYVFLADEEVLVFLKDRSDSIENTELENLAIFYSALPY